MAQGPHWVHLAAGFDDSCGIRADGTLWCWGSIDNISQDLPRQVTTPAPGGWASITAGQDHVCATRTDGTLWCWGDNSQGQLGIGSHTDQDLPRQVTGCRQPMTASSPGRNSVHATPGKPGLRPATTVPTPRGRPQQRQRPAHR